MNIYEKKEDFILKLRQKRLVSVLWHINPFKLFNANDYIYIYAVVLGEEFVGNFFLNEFL